jgi:anaerobic glycerol-3-phosphate dehydrogenase
LSAGGEALNPHTHVTQLIRSEGLKRQRFMDVGIMTDASLHPVSTTKLVFNNLKACGHILSGFDFARDRCGFGVSVASAEACF